MNQELEQYMQFFVNNRQKNWPEWLATAEFAINNKTYLATKMSLFIENYGKEMRIGVNIKKEKSGKSNRICKKDKKGTRRSKSSTEESTERNEKAS